MISISGRAKSVISREHSGYSCACCGSHEAAQVADHHEDVLVDRVHVEQVVLHLPDDAAEHRQVAPENRRTGSCAAARASRREAGAGWSMKRARLTGSRRNAASMRSRSRHSARNSGRRHALEFRVLLQRQEAVEDRRRPLANRSSSLRSSNSSTAWKSASMVRTFTSARKQARVQVLQQDHVDLADRFGGAIVALHELLGSAPIRRVRKPISCASAVCTSNTRRSSQRPAR